ncbi:serine--tRNA ligase [Candidatus Protofrankia californiensis]|uniref:serine--tRNA ligase n=1 Tax=Candidatus Protofrankia californiensis TaxID=1839754 RepID=UPI0010411DCA|nr:serine--tRNA ligase [Candidatus Protofrankia californiensis]
MLDRRFIRENPDVVREAARVKGVDLDVDGILALDRSVRSLQHALDTAQRERRELASAFKTADPAGRERLRERSGALDTQLRETRDELETAGERLRDLLLRTPNIPWSGAPVGADESANTVIRVWGERPTFDFTPIDHVELAEKRGWAEFERARNVSGERAYALAGQLVLLERAVHSYALDLLAHRDFRLVSVPSLVKREALVGTGFLPGHGEEIYELPADELFLAGTAEVALVGLHAGEMLSLRDLPLRYAGISPCFRREVGSAGRDVRGLLRVHQFEKVEQFVICEADEEQSARWHAELLDTAETVLQSLGLAYEVVECATGDMGLGKFRMNDINTWFPSLERFRETHSCSTLHDWQARRANIRYKDAEGRVRFAHTLNNTAVATPRLLAAILENFQTADHHVRIPKVLRPYLGDRELI